MQTIENINARGGFWNENKINLLALLMKNKREYSSTIRNEKEDITTDTTRTQQLMRGDHQQIQSLNRRQKW